MIETFRTNAFLIVRLVMMKEGYAKLANTVCQRGWFSLAYSFSSFAETYITAMIFFFYIQ